MSFNDMLTTLDRFGFMEEELNEFWEEKAESVKNMKSRKKSGLTAASMVCTFDIIFIYVLLLYTSYTI